MMERVIDSPDDMNLLGKQLGELLAGGEVFELIGDVGAGKTTFTKGLATGLGIAEPVQSPTFTISRVYQARDDLELRHYDFYRLGEAGIMHEELAEAVEQPHSITVVEWGGVVEGVLPGDRLQISIATTDEYQRLVKIVALGDRSQQLLDELIGVIK